MVTLPSDVNKCINIFNNSLIIRCINRLFNTTNLYIVNIYGVIFPGKEFV
jgi:hypothetical protein